MNKKYIWQLFGVFAVIVAFSGYLITQSVSRYREEIAAAKTEFIKEQQKSTIETQTALEQMFRTLYQTIRTISFLPGVQHIDRYGKNFAGDPHQTVQQLYNNAYESVAMSEIYILPKSIDPDRLDPVTKKPEEPIVTFDEFLVGSGDEKIANEVKENDKLEEVEIFEYRLMREQLKTFAEKYPKRSSFEGIKVPALMGKDVITCDNSEFTKADLESGNDEPRKGVLYTTPVYDKNGYFSGGVSAIVRNNSIKKLLPKSSFALVNADYGINFSTEPGAALTASYAEFANGREPSDLIFSKRIKLNIVDGSNWELWAAVSNDLFWSSASVMQIQNQLYNNILGILIVCLLMLGVFTRNFIKQVRLNNSLTKIIAKLRSESHTIAGIGTSLSDAASELSKLATSQSAAVTQVVSSMDEISAMVSQTAANTKSSMGHAERGNELSADGARVSQTIITSTQELEGSISKLHSVVDFIQKIGSKTKLINDIVFETRLLSFNASIEAARAGAAGKGFAVVAEEVGKLASGSGSAADEIRDLISTATVEVERVVSNTRLSAQQNQGVANQCQTAIAGMGDALKMISATFSSIASATNEQDAGVKQVSIAMQEMDNGAQHSLSKAENLAEKAKLLSAGLSTIDDIVRKLDDLVNAKNAA